MIKLKRWHWIILAAVTIAAVVFTASFFFPAIYQVCSLDKHNKPYDCAARHLGPAIFLWTMAQIDSHNGLVTAVATAIMAAFTGTLWRATTEQGKLTKEALVVSTRAFVFLEDFEFTISSAFQREGFDPTAGDFQFSPRWRNSGDTPTRSLALRLAVRAHVGDLPPDFDYSFEGEPLRYMIGPKANEWMAPVEISPEIANQVLWGDTNLYVWARADYHDVFGRARYTLSCSKVVIGIRDREVQVRFVLHGPYNRTDEDDI